MISQLVVIDSPQIHTGHDLMIPSKYHYNSIYLASGNGCYSWLLKPFKPIEIVDLAIKHHEIVIF